MSVRAGSAQDFWFENEIKPHEPALRAYLHRKFPSFSDVDDVVQESFLKAFVAWQKGRLTSAKGFLFTVAGNMVVSLFRKRKFMADAPVNGSPPLHVLVDDADVFETVCSQDELALISEAIARLPSRCRQVLVLRLLQGRDCRNIAEELGIAEQTVRVLLARGLKRCAGFLHQRGIPAGEKT
ncbi:MAG: sigma-70 family RNA polymerase sigma factor, partial [Opitutaceae bacterium]|nr:sigma-70 family RNA polymerase sigma factor [Opitutaceae bacterium]